MVLALRALLWVCVVCTIECRSVRHSHEPATGRNDLADGEGISAKIAG